MGRKKNKGSKNKGNKSPTKGASKSQIKDENTAKEEPVSLDNASTSSNDVSTSQSESTRASDWSHSAVTHSEEPIKAKGRLSKREQFERSRSGSSANSEDVDPNRTRSFSLANVTMDTTSQPGGLTTQDSSGASAELTQEALNKHTQLLAEGASSQNVTTSASLAPTQSATFRHSLSPSGHESEAGKRASMQSHDDCESGVGTFSVVSEGGATHREDDTFADDDNNVHPLIHADSLDIQGTDMHLMTSQGMLQGQGESSTQGQSDLRWQEGDNSTSLNHDIDREPVKESPHSSFVSHDNSNIDNKSEVKDSDGSETGSEPAQTEGIVVTGLSTTTFNEMQIDTDKVHGKPPSGSLQRTSSQSNSTELMKTTQLTHSHSQSANSELLTMSGTIPRNMASSDLTSSSKTDVFSTLSGSKTSTGMAYHSTYHSTGSDFAMSGTAGSHSFGDETADLEMDNETHVSSLSKPEVTENQTPLSFNESQINDPQSADVNASTSVISHVGDLPDIFSPSGGPNILSPTGGNIRASLEEAEDADRRLSLDYDLESSIESMGVLRPMKFSNLGVSLFDELKMAGDNGDNSVRSTPRKSRSNTVSSVLSDRGLNDTLGSVSEHAEIKLEQSLKSNPPQEEKEPRPSHHGDDARSDSGSEASKTLSETSIEHGAELRSRANGTAVVDSNYNEYPPHTQSSPAILEQLEEEQEQRRLYEEHLYQQQVREFSGTKTAESLGDIRVGEVESGSDESQRSSTPQRELEDNREEEMYMGQGRIQGSVELEPINNSYIDSEGRLVNFEPSEVDTSFNRSLVIEQSVDEILENKEHVASTIANLNDEIKNLQEENKKLFGEMTLHRNSSKLYKQKSTSYEDHIKEQRTRVKDLEIKLAQIMSQRENVRSTGAMTEQVLLLNTCIQVEPRTYESQTQASVTCINRASQSEAADTRGLALHKHTSTDDLAPKSDEKKKEPASGESGEKKQNLSKASAMLDKILKQMDNIAGTTSDPEDAAIARVLDEDAEPEAVHKWRHLAATPVSNDPQVLRIQRSLAKAASECEKLTQTLANKSALADMTSELASANEKLASVSSACEAWQCKYEGERAEVEVLRDRTQSLEKEVLLRQMENDRLTDEVKVRTEVMESGDLVSREAMDKVREERNDSEVKVNRLEADKKQLHEGNGRERQQKTESELCSVQQSRGEDLERLSGLESKVSTLQADKAVLQVELASLREEYQYLQQGLHSVEQLFQTTPVDKSRDEFEGFQKNATKRIEELKKHVFESKKSRGIENPEEEVQSTADVDNLAASTRSTKSTHSTHSNASSTANSVHNEILKQSELILGILRENGDIEDEQALREVQMVNWQDVKNSITKHLRTETDDKVKAAISVTSSDPKSDLEEVTSAETEIDTVRQDSDQEGEGDNREVVDGTEEENILLTPEDLEVKSQLSELASALSTDLGIKINLVVESPNQKFEPPVSESAPRVISKKAKQKMELENMNRDYEELRKKRLALLVQAYTGRSDVNPASSLPLQSSNGYQAQSSAPGPYSSDPMTEYDQQTAALRQRIQEFKEEIKQDRPMAYTSSYSDTYNGASTNSNLYPSRPESVLRQSQSELDFLMSQSNKVPRVVVNGSSKGKSPRPSSGLQAARSTTSNSNSSNPYSYRPRRTIYPHKRDYVPRDQYYSRENEYYEQEPANEQYEDDRESGRYYDDYSQDGYSQNGGGDGYDGYYDEQGCPQYDETEDDRYDDELTESEAYYDQQKRINAKAIHKMKAKLIRNQRRIEEEKAKRANKQPDANRTENGPARNDYGYKTGATAERDYSASRVQQREPADYEKDKWAIKTDKENKHRNSFHKQYPCEVDLITSSSKTPALQGYNPETFDSTYFRVDTKYKPESGHSYLVDKYISKQTGPSRDSPVLYKAEVTSQIAPVASSSTFTHTTSANNNYDSTKSKPSYLRPKINENSSKARLTEKPYVPASSSKYDHGSSRSETNASDIRAGAKQGAYNKDNDVGDYKSRYLSENKENYDHLDTSNVTFGRGRDYDRSAYSEARFTNASDLTAYMDLPSKIPTDDVNKITSKIESMKPLLTEDPAPKSEAKEETGYRRYRSPYDKYDIKTENDRTVIVPKDSHVKHGDTVPSSGKHRSDHVSESRNIRDDKRESKHRHGDVNESRYNSDDIRESRHRDDHVRDSRSHSNTHKETRAKDEKSSKERYDTHSKEKHQDMREHGRSHDHTHKHSRHKDDQKVLKSTSNARSRESSPVRTYETADLYDDDRHKSHKSKEKSTASSHKHNEKPREKERDPRQVESAADYIYRRSHRDTSPLRTDTKESNTVYKGTSGTAPNTDTVGTKSSRPYSQKSAAKDRYVSPSAVPDTKYSSSTDHKYSSKYTDPKYDTVKYDTPKYDTRKYDTEKYDTAKRETLKDEDRYQRSKTYDTTEKSRDNYVTSTGAKYSTADKDYSKYDRAGSKYDTPKPYDYRAYETALKEAKDYSSPATDYKAYLSKDTRRDTDALLEEMERKYNLPLSNKPSKPLNTKDVHSTNAKPPSYDTKPSYKPLSTTTNAVLNSKNLESLDRQNAERFKQEDGEHKMKAKILANQGPLVDDVSSVAGSSDADFVVTGTGDILRRKSKAAKRLDKQRNAELQMKSFDTPYECFEDEFYRQNDRDEAESEATDDVTDIRDNSDYWGEPKRHFGIIPSGTGTTSTAGLTAVKSGGTEHKYWSEPRPHAGESSAYSKTSGKNNLDGDINSSMYDQKWYKEAKEDLAKSYPSPEQKAKTTELAVIEAKEKVREQTDSAVFTASANPSVKPTTESDIDDLEKEKRKISELFSKPAPKNVDNVDKSQRRVHWEIHHVSTKPITSDKMESPVTTLDTESKFKPKQPYFARSDFCDTVKEMKMASGLYEVPKLKDLSGDSVQEKNKEELPENNDQREDVILPRNFEERQQIVDDIIGKYTKDYDPDASKIPIKQTDYSDAKTSYDPEKDTYERDVSPKASRIPVLSPTRESHNSFALLCSTPLKSSAKLPHSPPTKEKSAIPVRSSSTESKSRDSSFPSDISPIKTQHDVSRDTASYDLDQSAAMTSVSGRYGDIETSYLSTPTKYGGSPAGKSYESSSDMSTTLTPEKNFGKTNIPMRRGSDVEDKYRRDRSHSRDSGSELQTSRELEEIISRYTGKPLHGVTA